MKKTFFWAALTLCLAFALSLVPVGARADGAEGADAVPLSAYSYSVDGFEVSMDVGADCAVKVTERISVSFSGTDSHGIIRDFPLGDVRYRNMAAYCENSDDFSPYFRTESADDGSQFLSLYLRGSGIVNGLSRIYRIEYVMEVPALKDGETGNDFLPLDVIGYGWQTSISNVLVTVDLPEGVLDLKVLSGVYGTRGNDDGVIMEREGNTVRLSAPRLGKYEELSHGVTLNVALKAGSLSPSLETAFLFALGGGGILLLIAVLCKLLLCRQPIMTTTVNLEAPEQMDPLLMGKLIDNKVDSEDLGAEIFYLADWGHLKINFGNEKDPVLHKTEKELPADAPSHIRIMWDGLFKGGKQTSLSSLTNAFYRTAQSVTASVGISAGSVFTKRSRALPIVLALLCAALLGGGMLLYCMFAVNAGYLYWPAAVASVLAFAISALPSYLTKQAEQKWKKGKQILFTAGGFVLSFASLLVYLFVPCAAFGILTELFLTAFAAAAGVVAGRSLTRTQEYTARLGQILGFKQFILYTERDRIAFMLKENPELYYHILPYAQVLGITDAWTEKFKGLDLKPPVYASYYPYDVFDLILWNNMFRTMSSGMSHALVSRPSSSGGGGSSGSFGGGFGGGGFGGGGGRGC